MRKKDLDILKGIGILLMIFDHVFLGVVKSYIYIHTYIQAFHMPLFFLVSGYLWKNASVWIEVKKRFNSLLKPYIYFCLIYALTFVILIFIGRNTVYEAQKSIIALFIYPTKIELTRYASPLWFLPALFLTDILYTFIRNKIQSIRVASIFVVCIAGVGILYSNFSEQMLPFAIEPVMTAILFFHIGQVFAIFEKMRKEVFKKCILWSQKNISSLFIIQIVLVYLNGCVDMRSARYYNPFLYFINGIYGVYVFWIISKMVLKYDNVFSKGLLYLSTNSMSYVCSHYFIMYLVEFILLSFMECNIMEKCILWGGVMTISTIVSIGTRKYIPWIIGYLKDYEIS